MPSSTRRIPARMVRRSWRSWATARPRSTPCWRAAACARRRRWRRRRTRRSVLLLVEDLLAHGLGEVGGDRPRTAGQLGETDQAAALRPLLDVIFRGDAAVLGLDQLHLGRHFM